jgi:non-specific serine/threonine protein kinase/serine/threonine-protein kinase
MTPERWQQVKAIVAEAMEAPPAERDARLERRCGDDAELRREVESLLGYAETTTATARGWGPPPLAPLHVRASLPAGARIGVYRIDRLLGEGGMGAVYLAHREVDGYAMPVALKIIRSAALSEYALTRFRRERQILARLAHPNITKLLDGGVTDDGLPYLVTEYIHGVPLDEHLRLHALDLPRKLDLFLALCSALSFAHRNLVVHGDLKPGNILVTAEGTPKLLDFGIARLIDPDTAEATATATFAMTPAWASPEQLRGEPPSIASDLYSLGRVFYELLAGRPAFEITTRTPQRILEKIQAPPRLPSEVTGQRALAGDLDNIARKAIEAEPHLRYSSAEAFADDIRRYLQSLPISARRPTPGYRAMKFVRRHRAGALAATAAVLALSAGLAVAFWQARVAHRNAETALRHAGEARTLANSFLFELDDTVAELPGSTRIRASIMERAVRYLDRAAAETGDDAALQRELAAAYMKIGDIQGRPGASNLGKNDDALRSYERARQILSQLARGHPEEIAYQRDLATIHLRISALRKVLGDFRAALEDDRAALTIRKAVAERGPADAEAKRHLAQAYTYMGATLWHLGDWVGALEARRQALTLYERLVEANPQGVAGRRGLALAQSRLGASLLETGDGSGAIQAFQRALAMEKALLDENPGNVQIRGSYATALRSLGRGLGRTGAPRQSLAYLKQARQIYEEVAAADPADWRVRSMLAACRAEMARSHFNLGEHAAALAHVLWVLRTREELAAASPSNAGAKAEVAETHAQLGDLQLARGRRAEALHAYETAHEMLAAMHRAGQLNTVTQAELRRVESELARLHGARPR